jgi:hypothetical protein
MLIVLMVETAHGDVVYWFAAGDRDVMRAAPRPGRGTYWTDFWVSAILDAVHECGVKTAGA